MNNCRRVKGLKGNSRKYSETAPPKPKLAHKDRRGKRGGCEILNCEGGRGEEKKVLKRGIFWEKKGDNLSFTGPCDWYWNVD